MRMWMVDPSKMCRKHLLGEHYELHKLIGAMRRYKSLDGYVLAGFVDLQLIAFRHAHLVTEMRSRGYNHNSPVDKKELDYLYRSFYKRTVAGRAGFINKAQSASELYSRCSECRKQAKTTQHRRYEDG